MMLVSHTRCSMTSNCQQEDVSNCAQGAFTPPPPQTPLCKPLPHKHALYYLYIKSICLSNTCFMYVAKGYSQRKMFI